MTIIITDRERTMDDFIIEEAGDLPSLLEIRDVVVESMRHVADEKGVEYPRTVYTDLDTSL
jgi:hypothetical protein